jgi:hypothetical protein
VVEKKILCIKKNWKLRILTNANTSLPEWCCEYKYLGVGCECLYEKKLYCEHKKKLFLAPLHLKKSCYYSSLSLFKSNTSLKRRQSWIIKQYVNNFKNTNIISITLKLFPVHQTFIIHVQMNLYQQWDVMSFWIANKKLRPLNSFPNSVVENLIKGHRGRTEQK